MKYKNRIITIILVLIFGLALQGCDDKNPELVLKEDNIVIEYGERLPLNLLDYLDTSIYDDKDLIEEIEYSSENISDYSKILDVGNYSIVYKLRNTEKTLQISIKDTTAPEISLVKDVTVLENNKPNYDDYLNISELSNYDVYIDDQNVKYNSAGDYNCNIKVEDEYGNENSINVPVKVKKLQLEVSKSSLSLTSNKTSRIDVTTNSNNPITYTSSDSSIATVDSSGNIVAKSAGTAIISAEVDGRTVKCTVKVTEPKKTTTKKKSVTNNTEKTSYTVYRTKTGHKYHRSGCRYLSRSKIAISKSNAESMGLSPCSVCNP